MGFYPTRKLRRLYTFYAHLVYCFLTIPVPTLATVYLLVEDNVSLAQVSDSAFLICQVGCFIAKFVPFWKNADKIRKSIYMLENPIFVKHASNQEKIIDGCIRTCRRDCWLNLSLVLSALGSWATTPLVKGIDKLPMEVWLPYNATKDRRSFYFTYFCVVAGVANGAIASGVIDPLIAGLACQATGQLKILKYNLQFLWENVAEEMAVRKSELGLREKILYDKIRSCVEHHRAIINFVDHYEDTYSTVVFTQFTASVLVICNACLQLSMVEPFTYTFFAMISFLVTMLAEIFLYSYYGTTLYEESNTLTNAIYMGQWYKYDIKSRKALILLMERSKKPMVVTAGKILDLSLVTFATIIRRAYSLLAVLKNY